MTGRGERRRCDRNPPARPFGACYAVAGDGPRPARRGSAEPLTRPFPQAWGVRDPRSCPRASPTRLRPGGSGARATSLPPWEWCQCLAQPTGAQEGSCHLPSTPTSPIAGRVPVCRGVTVSVLTVGVEGALERPRVWWTQDLEELDRRTRNPFSTPAPLPHPGVV